MKPSLKIFLGSVFRSQRPSGENPPVLHNFLLPMSLIQISLLCRLFSCSFPVLLFFSTTHSHLFNTGNYPIVWENISVEVICKLNKFLIVLVPQYSLAQLLIDQAFALFSPIPSSEITLIFTLVLTKLPPIALLAVRFL